MNLLNLRWMAGLALVCAGAAIGAAQQPSQAIGTLDEHSRQARLIHQGGSAPIPLAIGAGADIGIIPGGANRYAGAMAQLRSMENGGSTSNHTSWTPTQSVLIVYDTSSQWGWAGDLYRQMITNLVNRFSMKVTSEPVENYKSGQIAAANYVFYVGFVYNDPLPAAFITDVMSTTNPVCWIGYNLWQIAWTTDYTADVPSFTTKTGFRFAGLDTSGYPTVTYNGGTFTKNVTDPTQGLVTVLNSAKATVLATSTNANGSTPYAIKGGNFYYVADNPFDYIQTQAMDRSMVFNDLVHLVLNQTLTPAKYASVRIEDVCSDVTPKSLKAIADVMSAEGVPFTIAVIPQYRDPLGVYNDGVAESIDLKQDARLTNALKYMTARKGRILMHGDTHQYDSVINPNTGASGDDYEFFRVEYNTSGVQQIIGPVTEDSTTWAQTRITNGINAFKAAGFAQPTGWVTPEYLATPTDYLVFQKNFKYSQCRGEYFTTDASGNLYYIQQVMPWASTDVYGTKRYPENLGFVDPDGSSGPVSQPQDIINRAADMKGIADGWASFYFHPFLDPTLLKQCIDGIKALGYTFVDPGTLN